MRTGELAANVGVTIHDRLLSRVRVVEHLHTKNYGCIEFAVQDPNGFRLVFSEKAPPS
jgi:hypothetical protein